jgi:hypothetical protein
MPTANLRLLLYLSESVLSVGGISQQDLQAQAGKGARANGHESDHHDGLRSLYNVRSLFHGTSANTKEA